MFFNFLHCELLKAKNTVLSSPTPQTEASTQKVLQQCFPHQTETVYPFQFPDQSDEAMATLSKKPELWCCKESTWSNPKRHPLTETALHQKVRDRCVAALAQTVYNLQSVLSGGFSSINIIKASLYYLFRCVWCCSLLICSDKTRLTNVNVSEVKAGRQIMKKADWKVLINWRELWDIQSTETTHAPIFQSQEVELHLLQTLQASLHWHKQVSRATYAQFQGEQPSMGMVPSRVVQLDGPQIACGGKIHNTYNTRLLSPKQRKSQMVTTRLFATVLALTLIPLLSIQTILPIAENLWFEVLLQAPLSSHPQALLTNLASWKLLTTENVVKFDTVNMDCRL